MTKFFITHVTIALCVFSMKTYPNNRFHSSQLSTEELVEESVNDLITRALSESISRAPKTQRKSTKDNLEKLLKVDWDKAYELYRLYAQQEASLSLLGTSALKATDELIQQESLAGKSSIESSARQEDIPTGSTERLVRIISDTTK